MACENRFIWEQMACIGYQKMLLTEFFNVFGKCLIVAFPYEKLHHSVLEGIKSYLIFTVLSFPALS